MHLLQTSLSVLRDRLYQALGQAPQGIPAPTSPWQKVNILPQSPRQPESAYQPTTGHPRTYQAQANSNFNTVTTGSTNMANYPGQYSNQYPNMTGGPAQVSTYNAVNPVMSQASSISSKGPLAHKYPQYPQTTSASYGTPNLYQPTPVQPDYAQGQNYYNPTAPTSYMNPISSQPSSSPTGLYPNTTPGGPYSPQQPLDSSQPPVSSFMDHKPKGAWNDPPMVKQKEKKPTVSSSFLFFNLPVSSREQKIVA